MYGPLSQNPRDFLKIMCFFKAMKCWLEMIKNIENILQEQCVFTKNKEIDDLIENVGTVEQYLHYHFKYNLSADSEIESHCCRYIYEPFFNIIKLLRVTCFIAYM